MGTAWFVVTGICYGACIVGICFAAFALFRIFSVVLPLLQETRQNIQDLGDISASAVGRASETMDLVENRVSQTMGQATQAGVSVTQQAMGVGTLLAGIYMASRAASLLPGKLGGKKRRARK